MIIITGGAGMIGSMFAWQLNERAQSENIILVDYMLHSEQWQNLCHRRYADYLDRDDLFTYLDGLSSGANHIEAIVHMGAISATTEQNFHLLLETNIRYSQRLWNWCAKHQVPYLYASSAATYGNGSQGYIDTHEIACLRPLNAYGYSKQFFDQWALLQTRMGKPAPPRWYGFKFFNVYGPNEYHKERMASVAFHTFNQTHSSDRVKLFRSHRPDYEDGMQLRDFIYVKDVASVMHFFLESDSVQSGLYNIGTGKSRSFLDLACATQKSMGIEPAIDFIDMPMDLQGKYQYFTEANIAKLRQVGYDQPFTELEDGIHDYVCNYLSTNDPYC